MKPIIFTITTITILFIAAPVLAATVYTNIGSRTYESADISSVTSDDAVTFTLTIDSALSSTDVYDKIIDSSSNSYHITAISGTTLTAEDSLGSFTTPATGQALTRRVYTTLTLWEADLDNLYLYDSSADAVGFVYNDSTYNEAVTINGGKSIPLNSITLSVPSSQRHDGTAGNGARIVTTTGSTLQISENRDTTIEWIEVDNNGSGSKYGIGGLDSIGEGAKYVVRNNIVHDQSTGGVSLGNTGIGLYSDIKADIIILNNIIYDIHNTGTGTRNSLGINAYNPGSIVDAASVSNNTAYKIVNDNGTGVAYGILAGVNSAQYNFKNNISVDTSGTTSGSILDFYYAGVKIVRNYNLSSDTTADGANSLTSKSSSKQFISTVDGSEDLHLKSGADAIDAGTNLGTTPTGVDTDIDSQTHGAAGLWDMGADEYTSFFRTGGNIRTEGDIRFE